MALPESFRHSLRLPVVGAPMFLVSRPALVIAQCRAGIAGAFPALNARPAETLDPWLTEIRTALDATPGAAPFGVNLIVHRTNPRLETDLATVVRHRVPFVITSIGAPDAIVDAIHGYGGLVFHDVTTLRHARRAIRAGVDGLILVAAGAGGHAGTLSPFALLPEVRALFDGTLILAGAIGDGAAIRAARMLGADLAYMGTRFIATQESAAGDAYKRMIVDSAAADVVYTPAFTGVAGNYLRGSIANAGLDPDALPPPGALAVGDHGKRPKQWTEIWGAGQGVGSITDVPTVAALVDRLAAEYAEAGRAAATDPFDTTPGAAPARAPYAGRVSGP
ncbi:NAD(P)H-dependent flavin oxidoreductase [Roseospira goensis]|uniref:Nitronate monooxygenase n=1 Tax=Roseospira goensis TaxID=391922 RepID=A0A7W6RYZ5_9PROT|nr:nitronate monooxygenase family protein [Roseospira goensis]MBB4285189.1 nitronate monooxygenase [Roseospira goensis]